MDPGTPLATQQAVGREARVQVINVPSEEQHMAADPVLWETTREAPWEQLLQTVKLRVRHGVSSTAT